VTGAGGKGGIERKKRGGGAVGGGGVGGIIGDSTALSARGQEKTEEGGAKGRGGARV